MPAETRFFATCPKALETLLAQELAALGAQAAHPTRAGVAFSGTLATAYRACLWSRIASRVLLPLHRFAAASPQALYDGVQTISWDEHIDPHGTLAVDLATSQSAITHSHYGALKVKDAIVDQLRARYGVRPSVDTARPGVRVNVYLHRDEATVSLDLSGASLHRRGYRAHGLEAPLKENLAAAILLHAAWPAIARDGGALVDLLCGSGTLPIEAALMAGDVAPGLQRDYFGFLGWRRHDAAMWSALLAEARERSASGSARLPPIRGYDRDARAVSAARENAHRAGLAQQVNIEQRALSDCLPETGRSGLVVANPPYGERLGDAPTLPALYAELGTQLRRCFGGWHAAVLTGNPDLGTHMGLPARRQHTLFNGAIECRLLHIRIAPAPFAQRGGAPAAPGPGAGMFANRLRKNLRHFGRWAARQGICCYRLYDADLHEYNLAIDVYGAERRFVHVQEYEAPATIDARAAEIRLDEALAVIPGILDVPRDQIAVKRRRRQKGGTQYEKLDGRGEFHEVREGACRFLVNFTDYLDTGLFLDHRSTRAMLGTLAHGRRFLNLFGYTATATVHAAYGGATATTTVDMSRTYLAWARRHLEINGLPEDRHELVASDVLAWLAGNRDRRYGLIFLDPPTFSRSQRMEQTLDVQRDHVALIRSAAALLESDGILVFSTNYRRFRLDAEALAPLAVRDITRATLPKDFERDPRIHQCFRVSRAAT